MIRKAHAMPPVDLGNLKFRVEHTRGHLADSYLDSILSVIEDLRAAREVIGLYQTFYDKFCHPEIQGFIKSSATMAHIHGYAYTGPNFGEEKKALDEYLAAQLAAGAKAGKGEGG